jgi:hypothetical protein
MSEKVTLIVTSCGRFDLLVHTIGSFFSVNDYPIHEVYLNEDSGKMPPTLELSLKFPGLQNVFILLSTKEGQAKALDTMLSHVKTEFYFSLEDDWEFFWNRNFISDSIKIMTSDPSVNHVWIREPKDHRHPLKSVTEINGVKVQEVTKNYRGSWGGFSHNPGLKRLSDYKRIFPNGFAEYGDEIICNNRANEFNYKSVSLVESACRHIGWGRHTPNFKI